MKPHDGDLMALADGELDEEATRDLEARVDGDPIARGKLSAISELGEIVKGHLELTADAVPRKKLDALWREIDKGIDRAAATVPETAPAAVPASLWRRVGRWFDARRSHVITGLVSAGAVAALALVLRGDDARDPIAGAASHGPIDVTPASHRPAEIESLDTPGGTGTVFNLEDEDGNTTVIWVTPEDTVEGI